MPVGHAIGEITRQGILASLTGGFSYEPTNTLFCNTVHMYIWCSLLVVPLLLGLFAGGTISWIPYTIYGVFVFLLFLVLKVVVTYLHQVFDKTEPIAFKSKKTATAETFRSPVSSFSTTRRETSNLDQTGGQMIELNELNSNLTRASQANSDEDTADQVKKTLRHSDGTRARLEEDEQSSTTSSSSSSSSSSHYSAASGESSANELLSVSKTPRTMLPADSLELISDVYRRTSDCEAGRRIGAPRRKYSFPNMDSNKSASDYRPIGRLQKIRKVRSTSDSTAWSTAHQTLTLPKMVNSEFALLDETANDHPSTSAYNSGDLVGLENANVEANPTKYEADRHANEESDQPCCSKSLTPYLTKKSDQQENSQHAVQKKPLQKQPNTGLHRTLDRLGAENLPELDSCLDVDLKVHITRFLEELIEKHPETLDAIENVRMNRLGRPSAVNYPNASLSGSRADAESRDRIAEYELRDPSLYNFGVQDGTHVAYDQEDTSQGAVHTFQDEKGNWWTYAFDEGGSGVAKALGSSRAIAEMFDRRRSLTSNTSRRSSQGSASIPYTNTQASARYRPRVNSRPSTQRENSAEARGHKRHHHQQVHTLPTLPSSSLLERQASVNQTSTGGSSRATSEDSSSPHRNHHKRRQPSDDSDSDRYIASKPTSIFHPSGQQPADIREPSDDQREEEERDRAGSLQPSLEPTSSSSRPFISFVNLASRLYSNHQLQRNAAAAAAGRSRMSAPLIGEHLQQPGGALADNITTITAHGSTGSQPTNRQRMALEAFALESRRRAQNHADSERMRWHDYIRLENSGLLPRPARVNGDSTYASLNFIEELQLYSQPRQRSIRQAQAKLNYYYRLKLLPKWLPFGSAAEVKIKLNRLSLTALFDRNNTFFSIAFDVWMVSLVTVMTTALISRGIFTDFSLLVFAFVVAGSQFSLLKSVQPDASSPVHGFNWLVAYSRPAYFCALALVTFALDMKLSEMNSIYASPTTLEQIGFMWNPNRAGHRTTLEGFLVGLRDLSALSILLLPLFFTIGLLPQVNTLLMHLFEQVEMHVFGGTATFSLLSSIVALARSAIVVALLCLLGNVAFYMDAQSTQNVVFSGFVTVLVSVAFVMSRWSSSPRFLQIFFMDLLPWWRNSDVCLFGGWPTRGAGDAERESEAARVTYRPKPSDSDPSIVLEMGHTAANKKSAGKSAQESKKNQPAQSVNDMMAGGNVEDPLPRILRTTLSLRIQHDLFYVIINTLLLFALHSTTVFVVAQPYLEVACFVLCFLFGSINHCIYPQLRAHNPWKLFAKPILRPFEFKQYETTVQAKLMRFERIHVWMLIIEKTVLYPLLMVNLLTNYAWMAPIAKVPLTTLFAFRLARTAFGNPQLLLVPLGATFVVCNFGLRNLQLSSSTPAPTVYPFSQFGMENPSPLMVLYFLTMVWPKLQEFILKMNFILIYLAPWQISWGSAFHAFAQPFSVPHTGLMVAQAMFSSLISAPLNPFLGSSFFLMSYVRPLRFWEKHYNTKRVDNSNLKLVSQLDKGPMVDDSSLNSIFYEHLTRSLQQSLAGDLTLGRWACSVEPGDCFILVSLYLSCMVHIIEIGNGFVTFQMRGLEFRGTYCHQREAEAISEDWADGGGCCCCTLGPIPGMVSCNTAWSLRSQAWTVTTGKYIIDGYSFTDNSAVNLLQVHELRRLLVTFYVRCIIYYALKSDQLEQWIGNEVILQALEPILRNSRYIDNDPIFCAANDEDFDIRLMALSRQRFYELYAPWVNYCMGQRLAGEPTNENLASSLSNGLIHAFCFSLSILGRRALGSAANGGMANPVYRSNTNAAETFLYGLHSLFKGDMRVGSAADEWVFVDPNILTTVISPAVRMALKLHQDHFAALDDFEDLALLFQRIQYYQTNIFISHEHDPAWRQAIIANTPSLLALRHMYDESQDDYKVIMLNKMHLNMRVVKLNRESVRAFWAGQQQELVFLRNRNPERGSIQNARQVLRNMINSSADQPIGYPIYVSPLTTSFVETHPQVEEITGPPITFHSIWTHARHIFTQLRQHFGTSNSSNMAANVNDPVINAPPPPSPHMHPINLIGPAMSQAGATPLPTPRRRTVTSGGQSSLVVYPPGETLRDRQQQDEVGRENGAGEEDEEDNVSHTISLALGSVDSSGEVHRRCKSDAGTSLMPSKRPPSVEPIASLHESSRDSARERMRKFVEIVDVDMVQPRLNESLKFTGEFLVVWPEESWRLKGGQSVWPSNFQPANGMRGEVVTEWRPFHPNRNRRSHNGHIYLVAVQHGSNLLYVPIMKEGVRLLVEGERYDTETNL